MMNLKNRSLPSWLKFAGTLLVTLPVFPLCAQTAPAATPPAKQTLPQAAPAAPAAETAAQAADRSQAYYHVAMASIYEDDATVTIKVELPDMEQKDIEIKIEENLLTIRGERRHSEEIRKENFHRIERYFGTFQRSFSLPATVDQEKVQAACDKGVLTITLPKKEDTRPKQINIEVK